MNACRQNQDTPWLNKNHQITKLLSKLYSDVFKRMHDFKRKAKRKYSEDTVVLYLLHCVLNTKKYTCLCPYTYTMSCKKCESVQRK